MVWYGLRYTILGVKTILCNYTIFFLLAIITKDFVTPKYATATL